MLLLQVSTYKIVTVNATRQTADLGPSTSSNSRATTVQPRLTAHPEDSATVEHAELDDEPHLQDGQGKDEMQTWMLLEASLPVVVPRACVFACVFACTTCSILHLCLQCVSTCTVSTSLHVCLHASLHLQAHTQIGKLSVTSTMATCLGVFSLVLLVH